MPHTSQFPPLHAHVYLSLAGLRGGHYSPTAAGRRLPAGGTRTDALTCDELVALRELPRQVEVQR